MRSTIQHTSSRSMRYINLLLIFALFFVPVYAADPTNFEIPTADGVIDSQDLRGEVVYIDFWASWCAPCRKSFPWMNTMHEKYADQGLRIIAINLDKDRSLSDQFLSEVPADFIIGFDPEAVLAEQFGLIGMPSAFLLNREGELVSKHVGFRKAKLVDYEASIEDALN